MGKIKEEYDCELILTMDLIGGKWKVRILWHILNGDNRFSLLMRAIPNITEKMLTTQLRELEANGLIVRMVCSEIPPRVEYKISDNYKDIIPIINELCNFTKKYAKNNNITIRK